MLMDTSGSAFPWDSGVPTVRCVLGGFLSAGLMVQNPPAAPGAREVLPQWPCPLSPCCCPPGWAAPRDGSSPSQPHFSFIPLPAGPDASAAARGSRKAAETRPGPCGSEGSAGDSDSRDVTAESGPSRSPGELPNPWGGGHRAGWPLLSVACPCRCEENQLRARPAATPAILCRPCRWIRPGSSALR